MQLTRFTDLGLRVLMYLASIPDDRVVTIAELAERLQVSANHLVKVVHFMAQQQWLATSRGKGGGIRLASSAQSYSLGRLLRILEQGGDAAPELVNCQKPVCVLLPHCRLKQVLAQALAAFFAELDRHTLAQLASGTVSATLIGLHPPRRPALNAGSDTDFD